MEPRKQVQESPFVAESASTDVQGNADISRLALRATVSSMIIVAVQSGVLLLGAHRWNWPRGWLLIGLLVFTALSYIWVMATASPRLLRERFRRHTNTKPFDKVVIRLYLLVLLSLLYVAGLDAGRHGWSTFGSGAILPGLVISLLGNALVLWSMAVNRHLETTVRIQEDHKVVTSGPYRFVRHPMYVGSLLTVAGWPLVVGSAWAYVPFGAIVLLFAIRTALEDRTLRAELPGYEDYARQTRYRLLPGLW
jgi:protein-S-isoprenylcysteine O-methyltransferase Ste14